MPDYGFYLNDYLGSSISADEWPSYLARAGAQLDLYRRLYTVTDHGPDSEAMAICAMAEAMHSCDLLLNGEGGPVQSASIGSVSVSYGSPAAQALDLSPRGQARELYRCACLYLDIYRGAGRCSE